MAITALEQIRKIEEDAQQRIAQLKSEAISDLARQISAKKEELATLEKQYEELTGKTLKGEPVSAKTTRKRLSGDEKNALATAIQGIVKTAGKDGIGMGEIIRQVGETPANVRNVLAGLSGISKAGAKATTRYFAK